MAEKQVGGRLIVPVNVKVGILPWGPLEINLMDGGIHVDTTVFYALLIDEGPCGYL